jgi:hypothetical protein
MTDPSPLPGNTIRVGVTGTRSRADADRPHVREQVTALLNRIARATGPDGTGPRLQLVSPLAEGADRLAATCALDAHYELVCPLPFPQAVYEADFQQTPGSVDEFNSLLARAGGRVLALDGVRDDKAKGIYAEARSYEAVGRLIVRNCDLIIGIWDGAPGKGSGGTADTIRYAATQGPPVVWIDATASAAAPRWIEDLHDLRHNAPPVPVEAKLDAYLTRLLHRPEPPQHQDGHGTLHGIGHILHAIRCRLSRGLHPACPLRAYLDERPNPAGGIWRAHGWLMRVLASGKNAPWMEPNQPDDPIAMQWFGRLKPAGERAGENAKRYRSSYVWVFALGAVALSAAAVSLGFSDNLDVKRGATALEFVVLALIGLLVILDGMLGWQRRAIEYRLLAELCRKQQALAPLAWAVPRASAWTRSAPQEPISWVGWLFSAWLRDTPIPHGTIDAARVKQAQATALTDLLDEQIEYHETRKAHTKGAGKRLVQLGEATFFAVLVVVVTKLVLLAGTVTPEVHEALLWLGLAGAILPAASAGFVGIRAYAELEMLAEQSETMLKALRREKQRIAELEPDAPLASQALGSALAGVATLMLEDLEGWARLFRGKVLDA